MFEEWLFIFGFLVFSVVLSYILLKWLPHPLNKIARALAVIGIIIHELCHLFMCVITNTPVKSVKLIEKVKGEDGKEKYEYSGRVSIDNKKKLTFLQAVLISLAPLLFSFWLFFFLLEQLFTPTLSVIVFFIAIAIMISIVLSASPSFADLTCIPLAFKEDPKYSVYQIFLLILSIFCVWVFSMVFQVMFPHEIFYYIYIMGAFYSWKYSFKALNAGINRLFVRNKNIEQEIKTEPYTRRRHKPLKPRKIGYEEAHW